MAGSTLLDPRYKKLAFLDSRVVPQHANRIQGELHGEVNVDTHTGTTSDDGACVATVKMIQYGLVLTEFVQLLPLCMWSVNAILKSLIHLVQLLTGGRRTTLVILFLLA